MVRRTPAVEQKTIFTRMIAPSIMVLVTMLISWILYENSWRIDNIAIHRGLSFISAIVLFAGIGFGYSIIYPLAFFRGASFRERVVACLTIPILWDAKEVVRVTEFFTFGESLYYGLNPLFLGVLASALFQMGLLETICRWRLKRRGLYGANIFWPAPVVFMVLGLVGIFVLYIWGMGVHWFHIYQEGYKALFG